MRRLLLLSLLPFAACHRSERSGMSFDTGAFSHDLPIVVWHGQGWLDRPAASLAKGWPTAACLDVTRDGICDPSAEPFTSCEVAGDHVACSPRPWKVTLTRTQVFDGVLTDGVLSLGERDRETSIHAAFVAFSTDGTPMAGASACWVQRSFCSTSAGDEPPPPLKLCGADRAGTVELELRSDDEHRTVVEAVPERMVLEATIEDRGMESVFRIDSDQELAQVLVEVREEAAGVPALAVWSAAPRRLPDDPSRVEFTDPSEILAALHHRDRTLLVQLVAASRRPSDELLLVQRAAEVRIWIRAAEAGA